MRDALRFPVFVGLAAAFLLLFVPHTSFAAQVTIMMTDNAYTPKNVTINAGDVVTWINNGAMPHTVNADSGGFVSGTIQPGSSYAAAFNAAGPFPYHCSFHGAANGVGMAGTITIISGTNVGNTNTNTDAGINTSANTNTGATSPSVDQLTAHAQALLAQIDALKKQLGLDAGGGDSVGTLAGKTIYDSSSCPLVGRSLKRGASGDDVTRLQQFLARDTSIYPEGLTTGYYGALTEAAVQKWQVKYNIVSSGTPGSTGYGVVGPRTASAIALLCTTGSYGGVNGPSTPSSQTSAVGGFITVTPISGASPLTVNVTATVNTTNFCAGATYTLDFGDKTSALQIPVAAGNCDRLNQTYPHTYQYGGTYQVKLSAGSHQTSATVVVSGAPPPPPQKFTPGLPRESFTVTPTSGPSPLTVTFSGVVNSNDPGFCAGGCASALDFGDGTAGSIDLPASVGGWLNFSVKHTYTAQGGFRATLYQGAAGDGQPIVGSMTIIAGANSIPPVISGASYIYGPPALVPGGDALSYTAQFDVPSSCTGYDLSWGDSSSHVTQADGGSSCGQTSALRSVAHQYAAGGVYTIVLKRGADLSRIDDISVNILN